MDFDTSDLLYLSNPSCVLFSWVPRTYIWIYFIPIILGILCIRSSLFPTDVFISQPYILGDLGQHFCTLYHLFHIGKSLSHWALMPCRPMHIDIIYLINWSLYGVLIIIAYFLWIILVLDSSLEFQELVFEYISYQWAFMSCVLGQFFF